MGYRELRGVTEVIWSSRLSTWKSFLNHLCRVLAHSVLISSRGEDRCLPGGPLWAALATQKLFFARSLTVPSPVGPRLTPSPRPHGASFVP